MPLFVSAFRRADELAIAMECRCYHGGEGRTRLKQLQLPPRRLGHHGGVSGAVRRHRRAGPPVRTVSRLSDTKGCVPLEKRNIALRLSYTGTAYHGWQVQKNAVSVAETLEKALTTVVCHPVKVHRRGPHRRRRPCPAPISPISAPPPAFPCERLPLAVNTRLPDDIVVSKATVVSDGFNAIGSCLKKEYTYRIYNSRIRDPFYVNRVWFYPKPLDESVMRRGGPPVRGHPRLRRRPLRGHRDENHRPHRPLLRGGAPGEDLIDCRVCADGFLYNMVRAMVGTCIYAAEGKLDPKDIPDILASRNRTLAGPTAPPDGLYMTEPVV